MATETKTVKGLLGTKLGMTQVWDENNKLVPVTVIEIAPNVVTQVRSEENDGYVAVQIAAGAIDPRKVNKPASGHFAAAGVNPRRHLTEVRTPDAADVRRVDVVLTEAGAACIRERLSAVLDEVSVLLSALSPEEAAEYVRLQRKLLEKGGTV